MTKIPGNKFVTTVFLYIIMDCSYSKYITIKYDSPHHRPFPFQHESIHIPREHTLDEKCEKGLPLGIGFQNYTPYVDSQWNIRDKAENITGIFPHILVNMLSMCCPNSRVQSAVGMHSAYEIQRHFHKSNPEAEIDISFPLYGQDGKSTTAFKTFPFIPIVTAPKVVLLIPDNLMENVGTRVKFLAETIINAWPMWVFTMVSTCLAGLCMWILDTKSNPKDFPPTFMAGSWDGIWWAFITMTTVGYGDLYPKSVSGRIFSMFWISLGVVLVSLFTGLVSAALNQNTREELQLAGTKIGAVRGSIEYQIGVEHNADMIAYENHREMLEDLTSMNKSTSLHAAMIDNFGLTAMADDLKRKGIRVKNELNHPVTYGMVLVHNSSMTERCFRDYVKDHPQELFESIADKLSPVKKLGAVKVEVAAVGKAFYEQAIFKKIVYAECGILLFALAVGITYELICRQDLTDNYCIRRDCVEEKLMLQENGLNESICKKNDSVQLPEDIKTLLMEYDEFHLKWIDRVKSVYKSAAEKRKEPINSSVSIM